MKVSTIVLSMALGVNGFAVNDNILGKKPNTESSLQLSRWQQDGNRRGDSYSQARFDDRRQFGNRNDYTGPPSIYFEAPASTEEGWWNQEKRNFATRDNVRETRTYSNSKFGSIVPVSTDKYDVTPDEWRSENPYDTMGGNQRERTYRSNGSYQGHGTYQGNQGTGYYDNNNGRQRQTLRANDRNRGSQPYQGYQEYGNDYDQNAVTPSEWRDPSYNNNNGYNYGTGNGSRGEVVGTFDSYGSNSYYGANTYNQNNVAPNVYNENQPYNSYNGNQGYNGNEGYDQGFYNDGLYDASSQNDDWWNEEKRDFSTNLGRQETRSYSGSRPMPRNRSGVTPEEWNGGRRYEYSASPVNYQDRQNGPYRNNKNNNSWLDGLKQGFRNVGYNNRNGRRNNGWQGGYRQNDYVTRRDPQETNDWWKNEKVDYTTW
jgi:hypothetical protein